MMTDGKTEGTRTSFSAWHWQWLTIGLGALWLILAWIALVMTNSLTGELRWAGQANRVISDIMELKARITDIETAQRGYVISGDPRYLQPYREAPARIADLVDRIARTTRTDASQQRNVAVLRRTLRDRLAISSDIVRARRAQGFDAARLLVAGGAGKRLHDAVRIRLDTMANVERMRRARHDMAARGRQRLLNWSLATSLLLVGLGILLSGWLGRRCYRSEQLVTRGRERYRSLFESAPLPMWAVNLRSGEILAGNAAAIERFGYDAREMRAMAIDRLFHADEQERLRRQHASVIAGENAAPCIWRMIDANGRELLCHIVAQTIDYGDDQVRLIVATDVTAREAARESLHRSEARFQEVFNLQYQWMATLSPDGRIQMANDLFVESVGMDRTALVGRRLDAIGLRSDAEALRGTLETVTRRVAHSAQSAFLRIRYRRRGGGERLLQAVLRPVLHDGIVAYLIFQALDITDQVGARDALAVSERRLLSAQARAGMCSWECAAPAVIWWSDNTDTVLRLNREQRPAKLSELPQLADAQDAEAIEAFLTNLRTVVGKASIRFRGAAALNMGDRQFELVAECVRPAGDDAVTIIGAIVDITQSMAMERRLQQSQRLEAVGKLTGGIAHDFNNLLTVIIGNSEVLSEELRTDPSLREFAQLSLTAASRAADLTRQLLAFARRQPLEPAVLVPAQLARDMTNLLRKTLTPEIELRIVAADDAWQANVDAARLESAILNLAINARDAMPDGGRLTIDIANARLDTPDLALHMDVVPGAYVVIAVCDTGHGMTPDTLDRACEPFFTTKQDRDNSGLGLSMVHGFVKQTGGHIRLYSQQDVGTTVRIYLPRHVGDPACAGATTCSDASNDAIVERGTERLLVVEDDELVRRHVAAQLEGLGYAVVTAANGPQALDHFRADPHFDLLFTDVVMGGGMTGRDLARAVHMIAPDLPVLFTSGYTEGAIVRNGRLDPDVQLLAKPYRLATLARKIRQAIDPSGRAEH